jgi:hypothetical protein
MQLCSDSHEAAGVAPPVVFVGGVDVEFHDGGGGDLDVVDGFAGSLSEPARRDGRRPGMVMVDGTQRSGHLIARGAGQARGAAGDAQSAVVVVAADDEGLGLGQGAQDAADDGVGAEPGADLAPCLHRARRHAGVGTD